MLSTVGYYSVLVAFAALAVWGNWHPFPLWRGLLGIASAVAFLMLLWLLRIFAGMARM